MVLDKSDKIPSLKGNSSEGAGNNNRVPHSANVNSNPFGTAKETKSKGIIGYLAGLTDRMGLNTPRNYRNTAQAYRNAKHDMEKEGINFDRFMSVVEKNIRKQKHNSIDYIPTINTLDDVFYKWESVLDQLRDSGKFWNFDIPDGWSVNLNKAEYEQNKSRYETYNEDYSSLMESNLFYVQDKKGISNCFSYRFYNAKDEKAIVEKGKPRYVVMLCKFVYSEVTRGEYVYGKIEMVGLEEYESNYFFGEEGKKNGYLDYLLEGSADGR